MNNKYIIKVVEDTSEKAFYRVVDKTGAEKWTLSIKTNADYMHVKNWGDHDTHQCDALSLDLTSNGKNIFNLCVKSMKDGYPGSYDSFRDNSRPSESVEDYKTIFFRQLVNDKSKEANLAKKILQKVNGQIADEIKQGMVEIKKGNETQIMPLSSLLKRLRIK